MVLVIVPPIPLTLEFGAAAALQVVEANEVESGQRRVAQVPDRDFVLVEVALIDREVHAIGQRVSNRTLEIDRLRRRRRAIRRLDRRVPQVVLRAADDQAFQRQLVGAARGFRVDERLPPRRFLGLGLDDVDGGHGADLHLGAVVLHQLCRELEIAARRCNVVDPEHQVPVGIADLGFRNRQGRAQVEIGDLRLQRLDQQASPASGPS